VKIAVLILATGAVLASSACLAARLRLPGLLRSLLAVLTVSVAQIMAILLTAGWALRSLYATTVVVITLVAAGTVTAVSLAGSRRGDVLRRWPRLVSAAWTGAGGRAAILRSPWALVLGALALAQAVYALVAAFLLPPYAWDSLSYHLPAVADWVQRGHIGITPYWLFTNRYPMNAELLFAWPTVLLHEDTWADAGQLVFAVAGAVAIGVVVRALGVRRSGAVVAGSLFFLTPIVLMQLSVAYTDVALAGAFRAAFAFWFCALQELGLVNGGPTDRGEARRLAIIDLLLGGLAAGMTVGIKTVGLAYVGVLVVVLIGFVGVGAVRHRVSWRVATASLVLFVMPIPVLGTFWYARNWIDAGNPLSPFTVEVAGRELFSGIGTPEQTVLAGMAPASIDGEAWPRQVWASWTSEPHASYLADARLGGLGPLWIGLAFPALVAFAVYAAMRRRDLFFAIVVPFTLVFLVQPLRWWSRFTIVIVAAGVVAVVFIVEQLHKGRTRALAIAMQVAAVALVAAVIVPSWKRPMASPLVTPAEVFGVRNVPAGHRTAGLLLFPTFAWADRLPDGARIATRLRDVPNTWVYPLLGPRYQRRLVMLPDSTDARAVAAALRAANVDYVYAKAGGTLDRIVGKQPGKFRMIEAPQGAHVYRVARDTG